MDYMRFGSLLRRMLLAVVAVSCFQFGSSSFENRKKVSAGSSFLVSADDSCNHSETNSTSDQSGAHCLLGHHCSSVHCLHLVMQGIEIEPMMPRQTHYFYSRGVFVESPILEGPLRPPAA